jgi:hypothetical protein
MCQVSRSQVPRTHLFPRRLRRAPSQHRSFFTRHPPRLCRMARHSLTYATLHPSPRISSLLDRGILRVQHVQQGLSSLCSARDFQDRKVRTSSQGRLQRSQRVYGESETNIRRNFFIFPFRSTSYLKICAALTNEHTYPGAIEKICQRNLTCVA